MSRSVAAMVRSRWSRRRLIAAGATAAVLLLGITFYHLRQKALLAEELRRLDAGAVAAFGEYEKVVIAIAEDGTVRINEEKPLPNLRDTLEVLKHRYGVRKIEVTIKAAERSSTGRAMEVMEALKAANISKVEFAIEADDM